MKETLPVLIIHHHAAVEEFLARAEVVPADQWDVPRAEGKWTPAQETRHLTLGYQAFVRDLRGEGTLRVKGKWWQRHLWRWFALPRILRQQRLIPVRAPRETRPPDRPGDQDQLLAELRDSVTEFEAMVVETRTRDPRRRVTHPYFDRLTHEALLRLGVVHARHHAAFLPAPGRDDQGRTGTATAAGDSTMS